MKEEINKPIDPEFERVKKDTEWKNKQDVYEGLASKFSELIKDNPIVIYKQDDGFNPENTSKSFDKVDKIKTDESGTGGGIEIIFNYDDYIAVDKNGARGSHYFEKTADYYKITKESLSNIMRMIDELINRSGYSEQEKLMMSKSVFNNFKNKIINSEDLEKIKK